jgi:hypothetical protein
MTENSRKARANSQVIDFISAATGPACFTLKH